MAIIGNWSIYTTHVSKLPLYGYYNPVSPYSIQQVEVEMKILIENEGPFDGVIGYSGGASLAAQLLLKDAQENPTKLPHERIFRWAIFINGGTPLDVFDISDADILNGVVLDSAPQEAIEMLIQPSNTRVREGSERHHPEHDPKELLKEMSALKTRQLADGRIFMTDGKMGIARFDGLVQGALIDIPTLNVWNPNVANKHWGQGLLELCEPGLVREHHHNHNHDFPRGHGEMKKIAKLIREVSEMAK